MVLNKWIKANNYGRFSVVVTELKALYKLLYLNFATALRSKFSLWSLRVKCLPNVFQWPRGPWRHLCPSFSTSWIFLTRWWCHLHFAPRAFALALCLESFSPAHLKAVSHPLQAFLQISPSQCDLLQPPFRKMSMPPVPLYNILPCFAFFHSSYHFITFNMIDPAGVLSVSLDQNVLEDFSLLLFMT